MKSNAVMEVVGHNSTDFRTITAVTAKRTVVRKEVKTKIEFIKLACWSAINCVSAFLIRNKATSYVSCLGKINFKHKEI